MHKHKILYIHDEGKDVGGGGISILNLVKGLDRNYFEPIILCPANWKFKESLEILGIKVFSSWLPSWTKGKSIFLIIPAIVRLNRFLKKENICLIFYCGFMYVPFGFLATKFLKVPSVGRLYSYDAEKKWHFKIYFVHSVTKYVTPSIFSKSVLEKVEIEGKKVNVIYHGLPDEEKSTSKIKARKILGLDQDTPIILNMGRIVPQKGLETLIKSIPIIKSSIPKVTCLIIGETSGRIKDKGTFTYYQMLQELINQLGVQDNVQFVGFKIGKEKSLYLSAMDLFVLPSKFEDFGIVLLEAMAKERAVVASHVGGIPEVVIDGSTGILVPPSDPQALANGILKLLNNPEVLERMGLEGRRRFESHFTMEREVNQHQNLYKTLLSCGQSK